MDGYSPEEWTTISEAPMAAGVGVSISDGSGLFSSVSDFFAVVAAITAGKEEFASSRVVQSIVAFYEAQSGGQESPMTDEELTLDDLIAKVETAARLVRDRSGEQESQLFAQFVLRVATRSSEASGGFLGFGEKVSDEERSFINRVGDALAA